MCVDSDLFLASLHDGRTISRWAEIWVSRIYHLELLKPDAEGADSVGSLDSRYSTKALTARGTAVRYSRNTGTKRPCTPEDVSDAISSVVAYNFVDNTKLPELSFIQVSSGELMKWFKDGKLNKNGTIPYNKFYTLLGLTEVVNVSLLTGKPNE